MLKLLLRSQLLLRASHAALPIELFIKINPFAPEYLSEL
jgi:hypothetical protein